MNARIGLAAGRQAHTRPAVLVIAGAIILSNALLLVLANLGCLGAFSRVENLVELIVLLAAGSLLVAMGTFGRPTRPLVAVLAQVPSGFVVGLMILPSVSILIAIIAGACTIRSLPAERRWTTLGMAVFAVSTLSGYVVLRFLESLTVPALIRCG